MSSPSLRTLTRWSRSRTLFNIPRHTGHLRCSSAVSVSQSSRAFSSRLRAPSSTAVSPTKRRTTPTRAPSSLTSHRIPTSGTIPQSGGNDPHEVFSDLNVLSGVPTPASAVETIYETGFLLSNGQRVHGDGVFLLNNDAFLWKPFSSGPDPGQSQSQSASTAKASEIAKRTGLLELSDEVWGILDVVYPKPDLLIVGTGHRNLLLHPDSRKRLQEMGINLDVMDTHNAAAQYNLLATERPGSQVAAALLVAKFGR